MKTRSRRRGCDASWSSQTYCGGLPQSLWCRDWQLLGCDRLHTRTGIGSWRLCIWWPHHCIYRKVVASLYRRWWNLGRCVCRRWSAGRSRESHQLECRKLRVALRPGWCLLRLYFSSTVVNSCCCCLSIACSLNRLGLASDNFNFLPWSRISNGSLIWKNI